MIDEDELLTLDRINKIIDDEPNNLNWYGLKFSILLIEEKYDELLDCIDNVLKMTGARYNVVLELRRQVVQKMKSKKL